MTHLFASAFALMTLPFAASAEEVTTYSLDNGMDVVVIEDHRAPVVVHMLWYRVGSADEPVGAKPGAYRIDEPVSFSAAGWCGRLSRVAPMVDR
jgi:zinc protease